MEIGDAYDLMLRLPRSSVDLIVTSPPYWGQRTYHRRHNWTILTEWTNRAIIPPRFPATTGIGITEEHSVWSHFPNGTSGIS